jgi:TPR repeat protein
MTLTILAKLLLRSQQSQQIVYAAGLLDMASQLGSNAATFTIVDQYVRNGMTSNQQAKTQEVLNRLGRLAKENHPVALFLSAQLIELRGLKQEALRKFRQVTELADVEDDEPVIAETWQSIARIEWSLGRKESAIEAWRIAALDFDNPNAYYELATKQGMSENYVEYLTKAAMSGIGDAAYKLGLWYSSRVDQRGVEHNTELDSVTARQGHVNMPHHDKLSREWFSLAAESDDQRCKAQAMLHIAWILRKSGLISESLNLMREALTQVKLEPDTISWLQNEWRNPEFNLSNQEFEEAIIVNGKKGRGGREENGLKTR